VVVQVVLGGILMNLGEIVGNGELGVGSRELGARPGVKLRLGEGNEEGIDNIQRSV